MALLSWWYPWAALGIRGGSCCRTAGSAGTGIVDSFSSLLYCAIGVFAGDVQVEGDEVCPVRGDGEVVEIWVIGEEGIIGVLDSTGIVDAEIDGPGVVGAELERAGLFHDDGGRPNLVGGVIGEGGIVAPAAGRGVADDAPGGLCGCPGVVVEIGGKLVVA